MLQNNIKFDPIKFLVKFMIAGSALTTLLLNISDLYKRFGFTMTTILSLSLFITSVLCLLAINRAQNRAIEAEKSAEERVMKAEKSAEKRVMKAEKSAEEIALIDEKRTTAILKLMRVIPEIKIEKDLAIVSFEVINGLKQTIDVLPIHITYRTVDKNNNIYNIMIAKDEHSVFSEAETLAVGESTIIKIELPMPTYTSQSLAVKAKLSIKTSESILPLSIEIPEYINY